MHDVGCADLAASFLSAYKFDSRDNQDKAIEELAEAIQDVVESSVGDIAEKHGGELA